VYNRALSGDARVRPLSHSAADSAAAQRAHQEPPLATQDLTQDNFEQTINENAIVIVDFWAPWCAPCRSFAPIYESASENHADIVFAKVNTEEQQSLAAHFQIRSIPTLMIFREQVILFAQPGMLPAAQLEDIIGKVREVDMEQVHAEVARQQAEQAQQGDPQQG
jgi:thioredoxin 1